jgi:asparagine synthetase B (glutamine-hydrolysing)
MPGLVVVAGDPLAEARARRAAQPMLRWPWERLSLEVSEHGSVAIGSVGERGGIARDDATGCMLAFEGELYGPPNVRTGDDSARELLSLYLRDGAGISPPEGSFTVAVWDGRTDALILVTDRFRNRELYVAREGNTVLAAGELKALAAAGFPARLDPQGVAEMLAYAMWASDQALLAGVRLLPGATTLVIGREREREARRWRYNVRPIGDDPSRVDDRELVEEFGRLLDRALSTMLDGAESFALSGGLDSRCVAAVLADRRFAGLAATYATPGSREVALATRAAQRAGFRHRVFWLNRGFMARGAPTCVWLADGRKVPFSSHSLTFRALRLEEGARAILTGSRGDDGVRMEELARPDGAEQPCLAAIHEHLLHGIEARLEAVLQPGFADELRGRAEAALAGTLAAEEGDCQALLAKVNLECTALASPSLFNDHLAPRSPYEDVALIEFCSTLPYRLRLQGAIQRAFLRRHAALARVPTWNEGFSPAFPITLERTARLAVQTRRRTSRRFSARLPARSRRFPYLFYEDVMLAGGGILSVLLEGRTLARGQVRREVVQRLISETIGGKGAHVSLLGRLVRLELFQRQFVDGDGAPPELDDALGRSVR